MGIHVCGYTYNHISHYLQEKAKCIASSGVGLDVGCVIMLSEKKGSKVKEM